MAWTWRQASRRPSSSWNSAANDVPAWLRDPDQYRIEIIEK